MAHLYRRAAAVAGTAGLVAAGLSAHAASALEAGRGRTGRPASILSMTGPPQGRLNPAALPVDPATCLPVYPHSYLKVNTVFEVARQHGLRTAWSDKHAAYEILDGP